LAFWHFDILVLLHCQLILAKLAETKIISELGQTTEGPIY